MYNKDIGVSTFKVYKSGVINREYYIGEKTMAGLYSRENMIEAVKEHARGHIAKHSMNVEVYLSNAAGVGEHPDILEAVEKELEIIAKYHDQLEVLEKYFKT